MELLDGKLVAAITESMVRFNLETLKEETGRTPKLVVLLVGDDSASHVYVRQKEKACQRVGIESVIQRYPTSTTEINLILEIEKLNQDPTVNGILVQLPLPSHIHTSSILCAIDPAKDVDGFHPINVGKLSLGLPHLTPCTADGIIDLLIYYIDRLKGLHAVIIGRSDIVGKPLAQLLLKQNVTVTICHSKSNDLAAHTRLADLVIVAAGQKHLLTGEMIKEGAIVVDVGIHREPDGHLVGDVDFDSVAPKASFISPVPGGVGPMTIASLMKNVWIASYRTLKKE